MLKWKNQIWPATILNCTVSADDYFDLNPTFPYIGAYSVYNSGTPANQTTHIYMINLMRNGWHR